MRASLWIVGSVVCVGIGAASLVACKSSSTGGAGGATSATATGATSATSSTKAATTAVTNGTGTTTTTTGAAMVNCNPVTAVPCNTAGGDTCDGDGMGNYLCFDSSAGPNNVPLCGDCTTNFCAPGLTCVPTDAASGVKCARYCCTDADCGGTANSCQMMIATGIGICGALSMGTTAASTSSSSSGTGGNQFVIPVCTGIPMTAPSMGNCYMVPAG